jgi:hypothetical protein
LFFWVLWRCMRYVVQTLLKMDILCSSGYYKDRRSMFLTVPWVFMPYVLSINLKTEPADSSDTLMTETTQHLLYIEDNVLHAILKTDAVYSLR